MALAKNKPVAQSLLPITKQHRMITKFKRLSEILKLKAATLESAGVFNSFVGLDTPVYIDPRLLATSAHPEIQNARVNFDKYFSKVFLLVEKISKEDDIFWRNALPLLTFPEVASFSTGLSATDSQGSGIGPQLAVEMLRTAREVINVGVKNHVFFELLGLLNNGIGPDRISDMTVHIIFSDLLAFSERVSKELKLPTVDYKHTNKTTYKVAVNPTNKEPIFFLPADVLQDIPVATSWSDRDIVAAHNAQLRKDLNEKIGENWKQTTARLKKDELRELLLTYPELMEELVTIYSKKTAVSYDFENDPMGYFSWKASVEDFTTRYPLRPKSFNPKDPKTIVSFTEELCGHFKRLVEHNGFNQTFYNNNGKRKHETYLQYGFYGIALTYCEPLNVKVTREPNGGKGPVDFEISYGANACVNIEAKFSDHRRLHHGWKKQLTQYNKSQNSLDSIYLVILVTKYEPPQLKKIRKEILASKGQKVPRLVVIDANRYPSASKS